MTISIIHSTTNKQWLSLCENATIFVVFVKKSLNFNFYVSQGSAATRFKVWWAYNMNFVLRRVPFPAVKEFWKSVKIWQRYRQSAAAHFFETQCSRPLRDRSYTMPNKYTVSQKKKCCRRFAVILSNLNRFSKFFYRWKENSTLNKIHNFSHHTLNLATLPCETLKLKFVENDKENQTKYFTCIGYFWRT